MTVDLTGKTIGEYKLESVIGKGAQAAVYKAYQANLRRWVAFKILFADYQDILVRFEREAKTVARLRHENIIVVYDYGQYQDYPYIVMEYVDGGTLQDRMSGKPMDWIKALQLILPLTDALYYAHQYGLVHRDVKPTNILMPAEDWPLLADFTLVRVQDSTITASDTIIGTPAYMSPEQVNSRQIDGRADIYALGVILFEMMTGRLPFDYQNPNKVMLAHLKEPMPLPTKFNPHCPPVLETIILKATSKSPNDRYDTMEEFGKALKSALRNATLPLARPERTPTASPVKAQQDTVSTPQFHIPDRHTTFTLPEFKGTPLIIGRASRTPVDVDLVPYGAFEAGVSRRHAGLNKQNDTWFIDDLGSSNGTFVNDTAVKPGTSVPLKNGDVIRCGEMALVFLIPSE